MRIIYYFLKDNYLLCFHPGLVRMFLLRDSHENTKIMLCEVIGSINIVNYFPLRNWLTISVDFCENIISKTAGHVNNSVVYAWHEDDMRV